MKQRILALGLACLMLAGCSAGGDAPDLPVTTDAPQTAAPVPSEIVLNAADTCYTIVRPDVASDALIEAVSDFYMTLRGRAGEIKPTIGTDWSRDPTDAQNDRPEILIGLTNRDASAAALEGLPTYLDFAVAVEGEKIAIVANTEARLLEALDWFAGQITAEDGALIYGHGTTYIGAYDRYAYPTMTLGGVPIGDYTIVVPALADPRELTLANDFAAYIRENHGAELPIVSDVEAERPNEILIGRTNRAASGVAVEVESIRYRTAEGKLVLLYDTPLYLSMLRAELFAALDAGQGSLADGVDVTTTYMGLEYFRENNYAADHIASLGEELNPGVQALLSCCDYYNDKMREDSAKGNKWIYSSNAKYVTQVCHFDDMLYKFTAKGGNCAAPVNWAFIDMALMPDTYRFWGDSDGSFARRTKVEPYVGEACEIYDLRAEGKRFIDLYNEGRVKTGDIFLGRGHTWIYRGGKSFYAAGHDSDWHSDPTVVSEDKRKAVFDNWVLSFDECRTNCNYGVTYQIRIRDEYMPKFFRNRAGELVENPLAGK